MAYKLVIDVEAGKYLSKLSEEGGRRIFNKIIESKENPLHFWVRLEGRRDYKLRIGDYRAIADLDHRNKTIKVTKIGHRRNVYEK
jgi:mRNA interferase RelE/StbE